MNVGHPNHPGIDYKQLGEFQAEFRTGSGLHSFLLIATVLLTLLPGGIAIFGLFGGVDNPNQQQAQAGVWLAVGFGLLACLPLLGFVYYARQLGWRILLFS